MRPNHVEETRMKIQVNTDRHIEGGAVLKEKVGDVVARAVERFGDRITRLEVHLADVNSGVRSGPDDLRCTLEARMAGRRPVTVTHSAATIDQAVAGAAEKLQKTIARTVERQQQAKGRIPYGGESPN
jgi:ribosome-associated translation inhibitor RaiA